MDEEEEDITSSFADHESGLCGGIAAACSFHDAEALLAKECRICGKPTDGAVYCYWHAFKIEMLHNERLLG